MPSCVMATLKATDGTEVGTGKAEMMMMVVVVVVVVVAVEHDGRTHRCCRYLLVEFMLGGRLS